MHKTNVAVCPEIRTKHSM